MGFHALQLIHYAAKIPYMTHLPKIYLCYEGAKVTEKLDDRCFRKRGGYELMMRKSTNLHLAH